MLPTQFRLKRSPLFTKAMASGKPLLKTPYYIVIGLPRLPAFRMPTRFGFIVSRKVSNRAVKRNLIRRRLREMLRDFLKHHTATAFSEYSAVIFIARQESLGANFTALQHTFQRRFLPR